MMSLYGCPLSAFSGTVFTHWPRSRLDSRPRLDLGQYHRRLQNLWNQSHQSQLMLKQGESLIWCVMWNPGMKAVNCWWVNSLTFICLALCWCSVYVHESQGWGLWMSIEYESVNFSGCVICVQSPFVQYLHCNSCAGICLPYCNTLTLHACSLPNYDLCCYGSGVSELVFCVCVQHLHNLCILIC
jgi:hypothetical protein